MESIKKAITENLKSNPEITISVNLGDLRELTQIIRDQSLVLERELSKLSPRVDVLGPRQTEYRLKQLFKQLTGLKV